MDAAVSIFAWCFFYLVVNCYTVPPDVCFQNFRWEDCGMSPTPVIYYYKSGSRCEVGIWRGCLPNQNMFQDEYQCVQTCIFSVRAQPEDFHKLTFIADNDIYMDEDMDSTTTTDTTTDTTGTGDSDVTGTGDTGTENPEGEQPGTEGDGGDPGAEGEEQEGHTPGDTEGQAEGGAEETTVAEGEAAEGTTEEAPAERRMAGRRIGILNSRNQKPRGKGRREVKVA